MTVDLLVEGDSGPVPCPVEALDPGQIAKGQLTMIGAVSIGAPDLLGAGSIGDESDLAAVR